MTLGNRPPHAHWTAGPAGRLAAAALLAMSLGATGLSMLAPRATPGDPAAAAGLRIDLNTASEADLALLPRIGPALAARIVEDRAARGPFRDLKDLDRVKGIGPATIERLRPHVRQR
jgi:competence protein ComEA